MSASRYISTLVGICIGLSAVCIATAKAQSEPPTIEIAKLKTSLDLASDSKEAAEIMARLGMLYLDRSADSSYHYAVHALETAQQISDSALEEKARTVLAYYYVELGNGYIGDRFISKAIELAQARGDNDAICEMIMHRGILLSQESKTDQALFRFEEAYELSKTLEKDSIQAQILHHLALLKAGRVPYDTIKSYFKEAKRIAEKYNDQFNLFNIEISEIRSRNQLAPNSMRMRTELLDLNSRCEEQGYLVLSSKTNLEIANTYLKENVDSANYYFQKAIRIAQKTGHLELEYLQLREAYDLIKEIRPHAEYLDYYENRILKLARNPLRGADRDGIGYLEMTVKEKALEAQEAKNDLRKTWMWAAILVGLLSLIAAVWIFRQYRANRHLVDHLRRTNLELNVINRRLAQNDDFHKQVIAILSHDLRQPFSTIQMLSEHLLENLEKADLELFLEEMRNTSTVSLQVMDGLLQWMKLQSVGAPTQFQAVSIRDSVQEAIRFNDAGIRKKNLNIQLELPEDARVNAQPDMLLFINRNILHNAIKYSPPGGTIRIFTELVLSDSDHAELKNPMIRVSFADEGPGIPSTVLAGLFKKTGLPDENKPKQKGTGLAMIICSEMMANMRGKISAVNKTDETGAVFNYCLPTA